MIDERWAASAARRRLRPSRGDGARPSCRRGRPDRLRRGVPAPARAAHAAPQAAVRGGLKGVRRSVKRGQSVEFTDYRDYALGDDLRSLDWNVYARLERLFIKLFVEEEDVTVHAPPRRVRVDGRRAPRQAVFAKRAAAALGLHRARVVRPSSSRPCRDGRRGAFGAPRHRPGVPPAGDLSAFVPRPARPTSPRRPATTQPSSPSRGPLRPAVGPVRSAAPIAPSASSPAPGSELAVLHVLTPDELDPPLEGDLRLVDPETGCGRRHHRRPGDPRRLPGPPRRLAGGASTSRPSVASATCRSPRTLPLADLVFAELRRRRVLAVEAGVDVPGAARAHRACCSCRSSSRSTCSGCGVTSGP